MKDSSVEAFLRGDVLRGDDFSPEEVALWFEQEKEGYSSLGAGDRSNYRYVYHALNQYHGYANLPDISTTHVLGLGSAWGDELLPLVGRVQRVTILDPSVKFSDTSIDDLPITYQQPNVNGRIDLSESSVDLVVCFGVLHHIPNVSFVISEIFRVLRPGGYFLMREPIVSMGDWRHVRPGLTKNERGIPLPILRKQLLEVGLQIHREALVDFAPLTRILARWVRQDVFNSMKLVKIDALISKLARWNLRYHAVWPLQKFRPTSAFFVCSKPDSAKDFTP
jgi:SAM-dependent methyltransferase